MAKREREEPFYTRLASKMAHEDMTCFQASVELELGITQDECATVMKNPVFQSILRTERMKIYNELAQNPLRTKHTLIGQAVKCIEKLMDGEQYDKAMTAILNLAKIEGFVGTDTNVNVFAGLSSKEMAELKSKLKGAIPAELPPPQASA